MSIPAAAVKELRERTGLGMMECKKALEEAGGDADKAVEILRKRGLAKAEKRAGRATGAGRVGSYIHHNGNLGVLVELRCETDFVANSQPFGELLNNLCLQVAFSNPMAVSPEELSADAVEKEREIYRAQVKDKPANIVEKIVDGKIQKFYEENCLLKQKFVKDDSKTIEGLIKESVAKIGENITIGKIARVSVGGD